jgi:hypothetical protein
MKNKLEKEHITIKKGSAILVDFANEEKGVLEKFYALLEDDITVYVETEGARFNIIDKISESKL